MTSIIKFTALQGALDEGPLAYHLQIDDFNLLLDCGWDEDFTEERLQPLIKICGKLDAVLLTYPDLYHLGAVPYLVGKGHLTCPVYATMPVHKMGQLFMYDLFLSRHNYEEFELFSLDDVDNAFDRMTTLKYSQTVSFSGKGQGIRAIPLAAGHMIGGTIWRIVKDGDEEIVYAVDFNHKKERHLNGCSMESFTKPSIFITDAFNANYYQERRKTRDGQLLTEMIQALRKKGNVLVAVDTAGRTLELIQLLETLWRNPDSGLMVYSIALLNNVCYNVLEFAKSQMEWMSDKIIRNFEDWRNNPFNFKHIKCCHTLADVEALPEPKVVLTSVPDLQSGFSRELFTQWCENSKNTIILTNRTSKDTLARKLIDNPALKKIDINVKARVKLEGEELAEYQQKQLEEKLERERLEAEREDREESDSDMSDEEPEIHVPGEKQAQHDLLLTNTHSKLRTGFFKQAKKMFPMFPYVEEVLDWDDYGEIIDPADFNFSEVKLVDVPVVPGMEIEPKVEEPMEVEEKKSPTEAEDDDEQVPTKCVAVTKTFNITARVLYIDFEGRSDSKSLKELLEKVKPRQLILVHGNMDSTLSLAKYCQENALCLGEVFSPAVGETVDATTERHIFQVKLIDSLVSQLAFCKTPTADIAWIDGQIKVPEVKLPDPESDEEGGDLLDEDEKLKRAEKKAAREERTVALTTEQVPSLNRLPPSRIPPHKAIFFSEPKLSDLKQTLVKAGFQAEFNKGALIVNDVIAVKKTIQGIVLLEGCVCEDYYAVRQLLYKQYAIV